MIDQLIRTSSLHSFKQLCQFHLSNGRWTTHWKINIQNFLYLLQLYSPANIFSMQTKFSMAIALPMQFNKWISPEKYVAVSNNICLNWKPDQNVFLIRLHTATLPECIGWRKKNPMSVAQSYIEMWYWKAQLENMLACIWLPVNGGNQSTHH